MVEKSLVEDENWTDGDTVTAAELNNHAAEHNAMYDGTAGEVVADVNNQSVATDTLNSVEFPTDTTRQALVDAIGRLPASGGWVIVPPGDYSSDTPIDVSVSNVEAIRITGAAADEAVKVPPIQFAGAADGSNKLKAALEHVKIENPGDATGEILLDFDQCKNVYVEDVSCGFDNNWAVRFRSVFSGEVHGLRINDANGGILFTHDANNIDIYSLLIKWMSGFAGTTRPQIRITDETVNSTAEKPDNIDFYGVELENGDPDTSAELVEIQAGNNNRFHGGTLTGGGNSGDLARVFDGASETGIGPPADTAFIGTQIENAATNGFSFGTTAGKTRLAAIVAKNNGTDINGETGRSGTVVVDGSSDLRSATDVAGAAGSILGAEYQRTARLADGTQGAPGLAFTSDGDTGIRRNNADDMRFVAGGTDVLNVLSGQIQSPVPWNFIENPINRIGAGKGTFSQGFDLEAITDSDPGTAADTNDAWVEVALPDGSTGYLRVYR